MLFMSAHVEEQVNTLCGVCNFFFFFFCDTGVRSYTQEEVTRLCSFSDFLVPSLVARKALNLSRVHLSHPWQVGLQLPGCISAGALTSSG